MASGPARTTALEAALTPTLPAAAALVFRERRDLALVQLRAAPGAHLSDRLGFALPAVNAAAVHADRTILGLAPDAWLLVGPEPADLRALVPEAAREGATVVDLSHASSVLRMQGPKAREVLSKICALDTHPRAFKPGACFRSDLDHHAVLVHAVDEAPTFDLYVARSFALSFWDCLSDAAQEFGYRIDGQDGDA